MHSPRRSAMLSGSGLSWWQPRTTCRPETTESKVESKPPSRCHTSCPGVLFWTTISELVALKYFLELIYKNLPNSYKKFYCYVHFILLDFRAQRKLSDFLLCLGYCSCNKPEAELLGSPGLRVGRPHPWGPAAYLPSQGPWTPALRKRYQEHRTDRSESFQ